MNEAEKVRRKKRQTKQGINKKYCVAGNVDTINP
jgi:hypothetical protein